MKAYMQRRQLLRGLAAGMALLSCTPVVSAQIFARPLWEDVVPLPPMVSRSLYNRLMPYQGGYLGVGAQETNSMYPSILASYSGTGQVRWRTLGRPMAFWIKIIMPSPLAVGNLLLIGGNEVLQAPASTVRIAPLMQWYNGQGDTLRSAVVPYSQILGIPQAALIDPLGCNVLTFDNVNYTLSRIDTLGRVQWSRVYPPPRASTAGPSDLLRTSLGGFLLTGVAGEALNVPGASVVPWLVETDAQGAVRRTALVPLFGRSTRTRLNAGFNGRTVTLRDGSGYVFGGIVDSMRGSLAPVSWAFVTRLDTALRVVWTVRLPRQNGAIMGPARVVETAPGTLQVGGSGGPVGNVPTVRVLTLDAATGAVRRQQTYALAGLADASVIDWQPQADSSIVVAGMAQRPRARDFSAWMGRYTLARNLAAAPAAAAAGSLRVYPVPAGAGQALRVELPAGAGAGTLEVHDALGRRVRAQAVGPGAGAGGPLALATAGLGPGVYALRYCPAGGAGPPATARFVLVE